MIDRTLAASRHRHVRLYVRHAVSVSRSRCITFCACTLVVSATARNQY